jgi:hypothetical protein
LHGQWTKLIIWRKKSLITQNYDCPDYGNCKGNRITVKGAAAVGGKGAELWRGALKLGSEARVKGQ